MAQYKILMVPVDTSDDVPGYVTHKRVYPFKDIGEEDSNGDLLLVTVATTKYYDASGNYMEGMDKLDRFEDGEYVDESPAERMDLEEV